jgi:hypothetical protein
MKSCYLQQHGWNWRYNDIMIKWNILNTKRQVPHYYALFGFFPFFKILTETFNFFLCLIITCYLYKGVSLWYLDTCMQYTSIKFTPSLLLFHPFSPYLLKIISSGFIHGYKYLDHIHPLFTLSFHHSPLPLVPTSKQDLLYIPFLFLFIFYCFLLYWGYIVTFTKVITMSPPTSFFFIPPSPFLE